MIYIIYVWIKIHSYNTSAAMVNTLSLSGLLNTNHHKIRAKFYGLKH